MLTSAGLIEILERVPTARLKVVDLTRELLRPDGTFDDDQTLARMAEVQAAFHELDRHLAARGESGPGSRQAARRARPGDPAHVLLGGP